MPTVTYLLDSLPLSIGMLMKRFSILLFTLYSFTVPLNAMRTTLTVLNKKLSFRSKQITLPEAYRTLGLNEKNTEAYQIIEQYFRLWRAFGLAEVPKKLGPVTKQKLKGLDDALNTIKNSKQLHYNHYRPIPSDIHEAELHAQQLAKDWFKEQLRIMDETRFASAQHTLLNMLQIKINPDVKYKLNALGFIIATLVVWPYLIFEWSHDYPLITFLYQKYLIINKPIKNTPEKQLKPVVKSDYATSIKNARSCPR